MGKRVLILSNHFITLYNFRKELIQRLIEEEHEVFISMPKSEKNSYFRNLGCTISEINVDRRGSNPIKDLKLILDYVKLIRKIKPNIVLSYTVKPNLYGGIACRLNKTPYVCNVTGLGSGYLKGGIVQFIVKVLSIISFRNATKVFFQNDENMNLLVSQKIVKDNYDLLPGSGVNLKQYMVMPYPAEDKKISFNFIGRIIKDKGIDEYLEAAKRVKKKYPLVEFNIIGMIDQEHYEEVLKEYEKNKIINYYGFQSEIENFIRRSSCTINPSYSEGMSNVLLESAACGRPIIASDISGCKEIVEDGINGYTFEVKNVESLVEAIERFIELEYNIKVNMGLAGRRKVENEFDRNIIVDKYIKLISSI